MYITKEWIVQDKLDKHEPLLKRLLALRGITTDEDINDFLNPMDITITHPNAFCGMSDAADRVIAAIENNEKILIYGDFDADGVTSTSLLLRTLKEIGADVDYFIPDRENDGHGLNTKALVKIMTTKKPKLFITCDCGISNIEEVKFIKSFQKDIIITDHHEAPDILPEALAIINPKAPFALDERLTASQINSLTALAGVGVAFKLAQALLERVNKLEFIYEILPYVAVGTVADVVPLIGENRYFVLKGLELISQGKHYGLKRLLETAGYTLDNGITAEQIAFGVAPRINASGRLDTVDAALKLMISDNKQEIELAIITLENFNKVRQELTSQTYEEALEMLKTGGNYKNSIILYNPKWHLGIIGIVASKLVETFYKPVFLMTYSEETKQVRCSARSVEEVPLYDMISNISELLEGFGGHTMAAGLYFSTEKTTLEAVAEGLSKTIDEYLDGKELKPAIKVDMELSPEEVDINLVNDISRLEPFGAGNPAPVFIMKNLQIKQKKLMGSNKDHLKLTVQSGEKVFDCIRWSQGDIALANGDYIDIAFSPQINEFNGNISIQLILKDVHSEFLKAAEAPSVKIYDHRKKTNILNMVEQYVSEGKANIAVFAEDREIIEALKPYPALSSKVVSRLNVSKCDGLMFFDYPADENILNQVIEKASPSAIHYMKYDNRKADIPKLLKTFTGMMRYTANNRGGEFSIPGCAAFLSVPEGLVRTILELFADAGIITADGLDEDICSIAFLENHTTENTLSSLPKYKEIAAVTADIDAYRKLLMKQEL